MHPKENWFIFFCLTVLFTVHTVVLILRKISKSDATRCNVLRPTCTKFDFRWVSAPLRELTALPRSPSCI